MGIDTKIFLSTTVFFVAWVGSRIVIRAVRSLGSRVMNHAPSESIIAIIVRIIFGSSAAMVALKMFDVSIAPMLTALGVGGLAMALALQDPLSNLFFGVQLIASNKIRPGDYIRLSTGEEGTVTDISWHNTSMRTADRNLMVVPNSKIASTSVVNYHMPNSKVNMKMSLTVQGTDDLSKTKDEIVAVTRRITGADAGVMLDSFAPGMASLVLTYEADGMENSPAVKDALVTALHNSFGKTNMKIN